MRTRRFLLRGLWALASFGAATGRRRAKAQPATNGRVLVKASDLGPAGPAGLRPVAVSPPGAVSRRRLLAARDDDTRAGRLLAAMLRRGAAGNAGDLYDNRDRGHSSLRPDMHPRLTFVDYAESVRVLGLDYGLGDRLRFSAPVIGNSSTAITGGPSARSQPRLATTEPDRIARIAALYRSNHLYVYPEHRDHDPTTGDRFHAYAPQMVVSQGSSGSDRPLLVALAEALAAMTPETKALLAEHGALAPTLHGLLRRAMPEGGTLDRYLTGEAHRTALDGGAVDRERLLRMANALTPETCPPVAGLAVAEEPPQAGVPRVTHFGEGLGEALYDTPQSVSRLARGIGRDRSYRLDAGPTDALGGPPPRFVWRVLRGEGVALETANAGDAATVTIPWREPYAAPGAPAIATFRVDIALFALRGDVASAPAVFSLAFPPGETRRYDGDGRPLEIDRRGGGGAIRPDPLLFPAYGWRDRYDYDASGRLLGWRRDGDGAERRFTRHGLRVRETDAKGRPVRAEAVVYPVERSQRGVLEVAERSAGAQFRYRYAGPDDRLGAVEPAPAVLD